MIIFLPELPQCIIPDAAWRESKGQGGLKEKEHAMQVSLTAPARTFCLEFLIGQ